MTQNHGISQPGIGDFWTRGHPESVMLNIGEGVGALVLYTPPRLHTSEIEVSPIGSETQRVHTSGSRTQR